jgi:hypothetical protein
MSLGTILSITESVNCASIGSIGIVCQLQCVSEL